MFPCIIWNKVSQNVPKMNISSFFCSKEPSFWKCALLEERMLKLLVNDKSMIVEVPIAYIVTLAMCHV